MAKTIIFDMDGVISDTQKIHAKTEEDIFQDYGIIISAEEITAKYAGMDDREFFKAIFSEHGVEVDVEKIILDKWVRMMILAKGNITAIPGVLKLINDCKKNGMKIGVASASPMHFIKLVLTELSIISEWDALTSSQEVVNGKPDPEIFLLAAKKLNANPKDCVVIEDGTSGMIGAKKAGMKCVGFVEKNKQCPADHVVYDMRDLTVDFLKDF